MAGFSRNRNWRCVWCAIANRRPKVFGAGLLIVFGGGSAEKLPMNQLNDKADTANDHDQASKKLGAQNIKIGQLVAANQSKQDKHNNKHDKRSDNAAPLAGDGFYISSSLQHNITR